jgi:acyl carrier protein
MERTALFGDVKETVVNTLGIGDRAATIDVSTPLLGAVPELDSMAVVEVVVALQERFAIEIDDAEITGEMFETFGTLTDFVASKAD